MNINVLGTICLVFFLEIHQVTPARILALYTFSSKSHKNFLNPIVNTLADKGHEIIVVSPYKNPTTRSNLTDILVKTTTHDIFLKFGQNERLPSLFELKRTKGLFPKVYYLMPETFLRVGEIAMETPEYRNLANEKFDLILLCAFMNEFNLGLIHKIGAPVIQMMAGPSFFSFSQLMGSPEPLSHVPNIYFDLGEQMNFFERLLNFLADIYCKAAREYFYLPKIDEFIKKHYSDITMSVGEIEKNVTSMFIVNSHFSVNHARPHLPTIVEVGCIHCKEAKPLPKDLNDFMEGAGEHGVIYFSFGSVVRTEQMPEEVRIAFLEAFKELPQRVLWKWHEEKMKGLPSNVKLASWMPQQDILGHHATRVFITHGGMLSSQESAYHAVPIVAVSFFGDQDRNMNQAEQQGRAVRLNTFQKEDILGAIRTILNDDSYRRKVQELSIILRDQNPSPLEKAVFWIEYVIRHKGANHLRAVAADMPWYQFHLVDVFAVLAIIALTVMVVFVLFVKVILKMICSLFFKKKTQKEKSE